MEFLVLASFILLLCYAILMIIYRIGWNRQQSAVIPADFIPSTGISIIIPARNEAENIGACIRSILAQSYPVDLYEVIVIDDHSTDDTVAVVHSFDQPHVKCIKLADIIEETDIIVAYKKKALDTGISACKGELIITTDADCIAAPGWLMSIAAIYQQEKPVMIVAPVDFTTNSSVVQLFQSLDFMSMQGITAATHQMKLGNMSNGANLAFSKKAFQSVDGYAGIDHLASGDDYLLMMKLQKAYPGRISYLKAKDAIVRTAPQPDWTGFLNQRIRWASKSGKYDDDKLTVILLLVYLFNMSFAVVWGAAFFESWLYTPLLLMLVLKTSIEIYYLFPVARFFNKQKQLWIFPLLQPLHIAYIISAGLLGFIGVYKWKGRRVR